MIKKICSRCVMDTSIKNINFDLNGICNYCKEYELRVKNELYKEPERSKKLKSIIDAIKKEGRNKRYDCIIGVSGGVDSSYVLYLAKEFELNPLAVHLDNGWNSELAVHNIEKLLKKLNIDLWTFIINWEEFKDLQKAFIYSSIENLEIPTDHAINALLFKTADKFNIRYILSGSNLLTEGLFKSSDGKNYDYTLLKNIHKKFGKKKLKTYPSISIWNLAYKILIKKIRYIPILNYIDYNKVESIQLLEKKFDWKRYGGKHYESIFTRFYQGYILPNKYNYDKRKSHLSNLIMSRQISRDEALNELNKGPYVDQNLLHEDLNFVLKKLDITELEFNKIINDPIQDASNFNTDEAMIKKFKNIAAIIKKIAKNV